MPLLYSFADILNLFSLLIVSAIFITLFVCVHYMYAGTLKLKMQIIVSYLIKGWGLNSGSLEDQQVPLATESALRHQPEWFLLTQPLIFYF